MEAIFTLGNIYFDIISIIILLIVIVSVIVGASKGFLYSLLKFGQSFVVFGTAIFLAKPVGDFIFNSSIGESIVSKLTPNIESVGPIFQQPLTGENKLEFISSSLVDLKIPSFLAEGLAEKIMGYITIETQDTLGLYISKGIVNYGLIAISFLVIMILVSLVFMFLKKRAKKVNDAPVLGGINRLLGAILNGIVGYITIDAILFLISFITLKDGEIANFFVTTMYLDQDEVFTISKFISQHSIIRKIFEALI